MTELICGHKSCLNCLNDLSQTSKRFPISCKTCKAPLHVSNLIDNISKSSQEVLIKNAIEYYLCKKKSTNGIKFCPLNCDGFINANDGYAMCQTCKKYVCGKCNSTDVNHENLNCSDYRKFQKQFNEQIIALIEKGKEWVRYSWNSKPKIINIAENPHLKEKDKPACKLFRLAIQNDEIVNILDSGMFAWHGTSTNAIDSICCNGFDPKRRSAQVHGPGEYFGLTPGVSLKYCNDGNFMLVFFILNGSHVKTVKNFCYVVSNPVDSSFSYCLPLLIVNFGTKKSLTFDIGDPLRHNYICYHWEIKKNHLNHTDKIQTKRLRDNT